MFAPVLATFALLPAVVHAAPITETFVINATGQVTASGSYTITFDPTLNYTNETSGFVQNYFTNSFESVPVPAGFDYNATFQNFFIGGLLNNVDELLGNTNDYVFNFGFKAQDGTSNFRAFNVFSTNPPYSSSETDSGSVVATPSTPAAVTPEPSSLVLLGTGLLGVFGAARRRFSPE